MNNRQAGRRRGRGGQRPQGGSGQSNNRIDNRARGNASQLHEKYKALARDAQMQDDRVNTEYYLQFADHYFRVLNESRSRAEEQNQRRQRDDNDSDGDDSDHQADNQHRETQRGRGGNDRPNGHANGRERVDGDDDGDRSKDRGDRGSDNKGQDNKSQEQNERPRAARSRAANRDTNEEGRANEEGGANSDAVRREKPVSGDADETPPAPKRGRGRPRREVVPSDEGADAGAAIEADRLPPALSVGSTDDAPEKPRRRRVVRPAARQAGDSAS